MKKKKIWTLLSSLPQAQYPLVSYKTQNVSIDYLINTCQSCIRSTDEKKTYSPTSKSQHVSLLPADLDLHSLVG